MSPPLPASEVLELTQDGVFGEAYHLEESAPPGTAWDIGEWRLRMRRQGAGDFSVQPDDIGEFFVLLHYELS